MQTLYPRNFPEGITFVRTYYPGQGIHVGELNGGGYCRVDGTPIQSTEELIKAIPPGPRLTAALEWFAHRDDPAPAFEAPLVTWRKGRLVYVESGAELTSHAEIIQAFPEESPLQRAALEWFGQQQQQRYAAMQHLQNGLASTPQEVSLRPMQQAARQRPRDKSGHFLTGNVPTADEAQGE